MEEKDKKKTKELDLVALAIQVLKEWKLLLKFLFVSGVIGVIVAFSLPKYYTSDVILAPEMSSGGMGLSDNLADMASSFGIELGGKSSMDAIYPELYPDIFASTDFCQSLFDIPVCLKDDATPRSYKTHLLKDTSFPFWEYPKIKITKWIQQLKEKDNVGNGKANPLVISKVDYTLCMVMREQILCVVDKKTSEITISVTDQDPMTAAIMADTVMRKLQAYITEYRTRKARIDYEYYDKMAQQAMESYEDKADEYNNFGDSHRNSILTSTSTKETKLLEEMENSYQVYSAMCKMREQAKAKIQERTPAFTVIQNSKVSIKPSSRPKILTLLIYLVLGGMADAAWVLCLRQLYNRRKQRKAEGN